MKKYISLAIAALCVFGLASCNKLLDYGREGAPTQDNYPLTDAQAGKRGFIEHNFTVEATGDDAALATPNSTPQEPVQGVISFV